MLLTYVTVTELSTGILPRSPLNKLITSFSWRSLLLDLQSADIWLLSSLQPLPSFHFQKLRLLLSGRLGNTSKAKTSSFRRTDGAVKTSSTSSMKPSLSLFQHIQRGFITELPQGRGYTPKDFFFLANTFIWYRTEINPRKTLNQLFKNYPCI